MSLSDVERSAGLPDGLPAGEHILWQGAPDPKRLGRTVFHYRWLALYVASALCIAFAAARHGGWPIGQAVALTTLALPIIALGFGLLEVIGRMSARATTYTLTNRRLVMRIGIAFDMTVSIPLSAIRDASVRRTHGDAGDIALIVKDTGAVGYVALWPHARPGHVSPPQPMLRALPDVEQAVDAIGEALLGFNTAARSGRRAVPADMPAPMLVGATAA